ncbi:sensor histidine kinase [Mariniblastus fucicola]|uniref:histidine kinase n=1 Tax=Mariniblastus fucicola TaxID=980251 RepID=A0A5B9PK38_9BACT|nr:ATP-binding protein [Mariniblastus fucicola]QEG23021.1 Sensor protein ZraS [Mariniblastus fucicola]
MYRRFFERERIGRKQAEDLLEERSRELYLSNQKLAALAIKLEKEVVRARADLERRKALENQLALGQKMESVGQLAAGVAHELNTPIQFVGDNINFLKSGFDDVESLLAAVDTLLEKCQSADILEDDVQAIDKLCDQIDLDFLREEIPLAATQALDGTKTLTRIVRAMKVFSHPGSRSFEKVDLNQLIEATLSVSRSEWKYHVQLVRELSDDLPLISCLPGELSQALLNLIVNAANAMSGDTAGLKSVLTVRTHRDGNYAVVEISDTGCGIPEEIQHRVFDPFFTTKGVGEGTGQGLSISYRIVVKLHRGTMSFDSVVGEGTTFQIRIPINGAPEVYV